jgi:predicted glutamine amidotransferase
MEFHICGAFAMCRFIAYMGNPLILDEVLFKPANSLVKQSTNALESTEPLNGDGFGLGWYAQEIDSTPALFKSVQPAWNDFNLKNLAEKIRSTCFFAHIRRASKGGVSQFNCHPFRYNQMLFMHNGDIGNFDKIKRHMRHELSDEIYSWINGQTDSEHLFALFIEYLLQSKLHFNADHAATIMLKTLHNVEQLKKKYKGDQTTKINAIITDGKNMTACRYTSNPDDKANSLYYALGSHYEYHDGHCHIIPTKDEEQNGVILIVSERLNTYKAEWQEVPANHILKIYDDLSITEVPIK